MAKANKTKLSIEKTKWLRNAMSSIGITARDVINDIMPSVTNDVSEGVKVGRTIVQSMSASKASRDRAMNAIQNNKYVKAANTAFRNAVDDIKSGKFNNPDRGDKALEESFGLGELDSFFDDSGDGSDWSIDNLDLGSDDGNVTVVQPVQKTVNIEGPSTKALTNLGVEMSRQSMSSLKMQKAALDATLAANSNLIFELKTATGGVKTELENINNTIQEVVQFQKSSMQSFIDAAITYIEKSSSDKTGSGATTESNGNDPINVSDMISGKGGLNFSQYKAYVKKQFKSTIESTDVGMMASMLNDQALQMLAANPMGFLAQQGMQMLIPKVLTRSLQTIDQTYKEFVPAILAKVRTLANDDSAGIMGTIKRFIGSTFGLDIKEKSNLDFSKSLEAKSVPFDAITRTSILHVIPKELREQTAILKAIAANKGIDVDKATNSARLFDYKTGKEMTQGEFRKKAFDGAYEVRMNAMEGSLFGQRMRRITNNHTGKSRDKLDKELKNFMYVLSKNPDFKAWDNKEFREKLYKDAGLTPYAKSVVERSILEWLQTEPGVLASTQSAIINAINATNQYWKEFENDPARSGGFNIGFGSERTLVGNVMGLGEMGDRFTGRARQYHQIRDRAQAEAILANPDAFPNANLEQVRAILNGQVPPTPVPPEPPTTAPGRNRHGQGGSRRRRRRSRRRGRNASGNNQGGSQGDSQGDSEPPNPGASSDDDSYADDAIISDEEFENIRASGEDLENIGDGSGRPSLMDKFRARFNIGNRGDDGERRASFNSLVKGVEKKVTGAMGALLYGKYDELFKQGTKFVTDAVKTTGTIFAEKVLKPLKVTLFGTKNEQGFSEGGVFSGVSNTLKDLVNNAKGHITGESWIDSKGKEHTVENSIAGNLKKIGTDFKAGIMTKLFGEEEVDEEGNPTGKRDGSGILGKFKSVFDDGIKGWKESWFGEGADDASIKENINKTVSKYLPNAGTGAVVGASAGLLSGGALGAIVGGPIGGAAMGLAGGILSKSESFQRFMFGDMDEDGNRIGGFISAETQKYVKDNKNVILGGAGVGALTGALTGGGLLGTIVGGPIAGAAMGIAGGLFAKSNMVHEFLFGDEKTGQKGIFARISDGFKKNKKERDSTLTAGGKALGMGALGTVGGALTGAAIAKMGVLGAAFSPLGPIGGAAIGLGASIIAQHKNIKTFLFGTGEYEDVLDKDGNKVGSIKDVGLLGQFGRMLQVNMLQPMKDTFKNIADETGHFIKFKVLDSIRFAFDPLVSIASNAYNAIRDRIGNTVSNIADTIQQKAHAAVTAMGKFVFSPITKVMTGAANVFSKGVRAIVRVPFSIMDSIVWYTQSTLKRGLDAVKTGLKKHLFDPIKTHVVDPLKNMVKNTVKGFFSKVFKVVTAPFMAVAGVGRFLRDRFMGGSEERQAKHTKLYNSIFNDPKEERSARNEERKADRERMRRERYERQQHSRNTKIMWEASGGRLTADTEENRRILEQIDPKAYKRLGLKVKGLGGTNDPNATNIQGMRDDEIQNTNPEKLGTDERQLQTALGIKGLVSDIGDLLSDVFGRKKKKSNSNGGDDSSGDSDSESDEENQGPEPAKNYDETSGSGFGSELINGAKQTSASVYNTLDFIFGDGKNKKNMFTRMYHRYFKKPTTDTDSDVDPDDVPHYAEGTPEGGHPGGPALVGEEGPELWMDMPKGSEVFPTKSAIPVTIVDMTNTAATKLSEADNDTTVSNITSDASEAVGGEDTNDIDNIPELVKATNTIGADIGDSLAILTKGKDNEAREDAIRDSVTNIDAMNRMNEAAERGRENTKLAKEAREKARKEMMEQENHDNIQKQAEGQSKFSKLWSSIFSKKGLITAAIVAGIPLALKFFSKAKGIFGLVGDFIKRISEKFFGGHNDNDDGNSITDKVIENVREVGGLINPMGDSDDDGNSNLTEFVLGDDGQGDHQTYAREKVLVHLPAKGLVKAGKFVKKGVQHIKDIKNGKVKSTYTKAKDRGNAVKNWIDKRFVKKGGKEAAEEVVQEGAEAAVKNVAADSADDIAELVIPDNMTTTVTNVSPTTTTSFGDNMLTWTDPTATSTIGSEATESFIKSNTDDAAKVVSSKVGKEAVEEAAENVAKQATKETVESSVKKVAGEAANFADDLAKSKGKLLEKTSEAVKSLFDFAVNKVKSAGVKLGKVTGLSKLSSTIIKCLQSHFPKIMGAISALLGATVTLASTVVGYAAKESTWVVLGALNGLTGAARLFRVSKGDVDATMVLISGAIGAAAGTTVGQICDIVNELVSDVLGVDMFSELAVLLYKAIQLLLGNEEKVEEIDAKQDNFHKEFEVARKEDIEKQFNTMKAAGMIDAEMTLDEFNQKVGSGEIKAKTQSFADYNEEKNAGIVSKMGTGIAKGAKATWRGIKGFFVGNKQRRYRDKNGNLFIDNGDGTYQVQDAEGNDLGYVSADAIDPSTMTEESTKSGLNIIGKTWEGMKFLGGKIGEGAKAVWGGMKHVGGKIADGASAAWGGIKKGAGALWGGIKKGADFMTGTSTKSIMARTALKAIPGVGQVASLAFGVASLVRGNSKVDDKFFQNKTFVCLDGSMYKSTDGSTFKLYSATGEEIADTQITREDLVNGIQSGDISLTDESMDLFEDSKTRMENLKGPRRLLANVVFNAKDKVVNLWNSVTDRAKKIGEKVIDTAKNVGTSIKNRLVAHEDYPWYDVDGTFYMADGARAAHYNANGSLIEYISNKKFESLQSTTLTKGDEKIKVDSGIKAELKGYRDKIVGVWNTAVGKIKEVGAWVGDKAKKVGEKLLNVGKDVGTAVKNSFVGREDYPWYDIDGTFYMGDGPRAAHYNANGSMIGYISNEKFEELKATTLVKGKTKKKVSADFVTRIEGAIDMVIKGWNTAVDGVKKGATWVADRAKGAWNWIKDKAGVVGTSISHAFVGRKDYVWYDTDGSYYMEDNGHYNHYSATGAMLGTASAEEIEPMKASGALTQSKVPVKVGPDIATRFYGLADKAVGLWNTAVDKVKQGVEWVGDKVSKAWSTVKDGFIKTFVGKKKTVFGASDGSYYEDAGDGTYRKYSVTNALLEEGIPADQVDPLIASGVLVPIEKREDSTLKQAYTKIRDGAINMWHNATGKVADAYHAVADKVSGIYNKIKEHGGVFGSIKWLFSGSSQKVWTDPSGNYFDKDGNYFNSNGDKIGSISKSELEEKISSGILSEYEKVTDAPAKKALDKIRDGVKGAWEKAKSVVSSAWDKFSSWLVGANSGSATGTDGGSGGGRGFRDLQPSMAANTDMFVKGVNGGSGIGFGGFGPVVTSSSYSAPKDRIVGGSIRLGGGGRPVAIGGGYGYSPTSSQLTPTGRTQAAALDGAFSPSNPAGLTPHQLSMQRHDVGPSAPTVSTSENGGGGRGRRHIRGGRGKGLLRRLRSHIRGGRDGANTDSSSSSATNTSTSSGSGINLSGALCIGDSILGTMKSLLTAEGATVYYQVSANANFFLGSVGSPSSEGVCKKGEKFDWSKISSMSKPSAIVIVLGHNTCGSTSSANTGVGWIKDLVTKLKGQFPGVTINICSAVPCGAKFSNASAYMEAQKHTNSALQSYCNGGGLKYVDITPGYAGSDGYAVAANVSSADGLHPTSKGAAILVANLKSGGSSSSSAGSSSTSGSSSSGSSSGSSGGKSSTSILGLIGNFLSEFGNRAMDGSLTGVYNTDWENWWRGGSSTTTTTTSSSSSSTNTSSASSSSSDSKGTLGTGAVPQQVWNWLTSKGYSKEASAGILGNMMAESGVDPTKLQKPTPHAAGIVQWESYKKQSGRWKAMADYAKSKGKEWTDLESQLEFMDKEIAGSNAYYFKRLGYDYDKFKQINDVSTATDIFEKAFERAGVPALEKRRGYAKQFYSQFAGGGSGRGRRHGGRGLFNKLRDKRKAKHGGRDGVDRGKWMAVVKEVKEAIAAQKCGYSQTKHIKITVGGKQMTVRPDCSGYVTACCRAYGVYDGADMWTGVMDSPNSTMAKTGFTYQKWPGWESLERGDVVVVNNSSSGHTEIFDRNEGGSHYVWNCGSDASTNSPIPTKSGHRSYECIWKPCGPGGGCINVNGVSSSSSSSSDSSSDSGSSEPEDSPLITAIGGFLGEFASRAMNGFMTGNYDSDYSSFWAGVNTSGSSSSSGSSTGSVSGSGNFPKYNLSEDQIKGVANIVQHEQGTVAGRYAEASQMANLTDIDGDDKATPENLIKKLKSGWYAKGASRYEAGASGSAKIEDSALQAVKDVIVGGKRTLPRYINEHDYIGDIASVSPGSKGDKSSWVPHSTVIQQGSGVGGGKWTFYGFPDSSSDPFGYTSAEKRKQYGDNCYSVGGGAGRGRKRFRRGGRGDTVNDFSYFSQEDPQWSSMAYGDDGATIGDSGCAPAAMSMVASELTGRDIDPTQFSAFAEQTGDRDETGTNWNFINKAAEATGLSDIEVYNPSSDFIKASLKSGNPMILSGTSDGEGPYTSAGHYVVGVGMSGNKVLVNDPRGASYSRAYDIDELTDNTGAAWSFGGRGEYDAVHTKGSAMDELLNSLSKTPRSNVNGSDDRLDRLERLMTSMVDALDMSNRYLGQITDNTGQLVDSAGNVISSETGSSSDANSRGASMNPNRRGNNQSTIADRLKELKDQNNANKITRNERIARRIAAGI